MPAAKTTSVLMTKLGARFKQLYDATKDQEVTYDTAGNLPEGIENGIAKLFEIKIDTFKNGDNTGQPYFYASGTVVLPKEVNGIPVEGLHTRIGPEPICETPKTQGQRKTAQDHFAWVVNEVKKLGLDLTKIPHDSFEAALAALKSPEANVHFRFRTWKGKPTPEFPNPRVNHVWNGVVTNFDAAAAEANGTNDQTDGAATQVAPPAAPAPAAAKPAGKAGPAKAAPAAAAAPAPAAEPDVDELLARANSGDAEAINQLNDMAIANGHDAQSVNDAPDWAAVAEMARTPAGEGGGGAATDAEAPAWKPAVNETYGYSPPGKKPGSKLAKVNATVRAVDETAETVDLTNTKNSKIEYKKVPWADLESAD